MSTLFQRFNELHQQEEPLLIGNVWNVQSAKIYENNNFKAIGTSSAAVAETLGYADGEQMSFEEYLFVVKRIANSVSIPLTVDLEAGYGKTVTEIVANIKKLHELGVSGVNIEDSVLVNGDRKIVDTESFAAKIKAITTELSASKIDLFINLRSDVFLLGLYNALAEAQKRIESYRSTGAHGLFFPCVTKTEDIITLTKATNLPVNVMCMPTLPDFTTLKNAGVKRISMGGFLNRKAYQFLEAETQIILDQKSFVSVFEN